MGARFYDPYLNRWLSADTIVPNPSNPQNLNRYSYVGGHPLNATDPSGHMELNEGDEYQEAYAEETYYCYINPTVPGCQTNWNDVRDAGLMFVGYVAVPPLIKEVITMVGLKVAAWRLAKATAEEAMESAMTGRKPDAVNILLDAATEIGDEYYIAARRSGPRGVDPDHHNANVTVRDANGRVIHHERIVSGNMTPEEQALPFPRNTLASHTEARAVRSIPLQVDQSMTITGQLPPCPSCKGAMNQASQATGAIIVYRWRENGRTCQWTAAPR